MLLITLAYLGGVLTILSPCILPVLPFVFARADQPFVRSGLPLLGGMAATFAAVATLAAVGGGWVAQANEYGRWLAIVLLAVFGITLLSPRLAGRIMQPLVNVGNRLTETTQQARAPGVGASFLLGIATGLLWAPCAGPILGLILTGAALQGASIGTTLLLLAYAAGAATSLAVALLLGGRVFAAMKRSLGAGEWIRRGIGVAMLAGVAAVALGLDTGVLTRISTVATGGLEQHLVDTFAPSKHGAMAMSGAVNSSESSIGAQTTQTAQTTNTPTGRADSENTMAAGAMAANGGAMMRAADALRPATTTLPVLGQLPPLDGAVQWLNSPPLTAQALRGKVVIVDFWTYSCINCLRSLPYVKAWAGKYRDLGLVVIGVHAPEFAFERNIDNVRKAVHDLGVDYPVAIDNRYAIWRAFDNQYWPAHYFADAQGRIRYQHFGEGDYDQSERVIQQLLVEAGHPEAINVPIGLGGAAERGVQMQADNADMRSPETYIGFERAEGFASPGGFAQDRARDYRAPSHPELNHWGLAGEWSVGAEHATLATPGGEIVYRFHARDLHLVLGPGPDGKPVRFRVTVDGKAPEHAHGSDVAPDGVGVITQQRLYQLVRQPGDVADHTFAIQFLDPGVQAFAFTFG
ncbi:cytochrome c biogenesis protein DipZ [Paraburkholderia tropica]|uniref:Cytochrome c biogenesis protein CcdA n=1 Tax=Paraburkholderia tropica TaxID=92647 RepID=A0ABX5MLV3_9BURK|nr:cytochrome c biogenesis protein DipZ [Paraburkholderia tropica]MBB3002073.1 cytochrome c biogenesis protein CcdA/thiol-disulfide isomerase/thioredoxin [Paraburkholderia tropica]MBB6321456.1 cytochrome c biogenesis protein CcdA/thiol-disulfide isomerase/thioredoxin [Paraburkholderia tropica]PXX14081.1 cytochrome c biogenesis protein CcdA [Paraburkholderia tropica]PZW78917.1 cytochrome c biogenesis protein CcdA [Paraburkholderia tropica]QNB13237.1 cytochrome c biogenesis protein DipZ [Parabur